MADATKTVTIQGENFELPVMYEEGHTLNKAEAAVLSQVWFENVRNNTARWLKAAHDEANEMTLDEARVAVTEYANGYEFTEAGVGGGLRQYSPLDREARSLVKGALRKHFKQQGKLMKDIPSEEIEALIEANYQKEAVQKQAAENLKRAEKVTEIVTGDL